MRGRTKLRLLIATAAVTAACLTGAAPAIADDDTYLYPAGTACDFDLKISASGRLSGLVATAPVATGTLLTAGRGRSLTFTNVGTGASASVSTAESDGVTLRASGSVTRTTANADGSATVST